MWPELLLSLPEDAEELADRREDIVYSLQAGYSGVPFRQCV